jgi:hypothetical protein
MWKMGGRVMKKVHYKKLLVLILSVVMLFNIILPVSGVAEGGYSIDLKSPIGKKWADEGSFLGDASRMKLHYCFKRFLIRSLKME